jgi:predicted AAA+ superfamily ATPase
LHGRYYYYRLHPFTLGEINRNPSAADLEHLLACGGFPEPFLKANSRFLTRWQRGRLERIFTQDIRDLEAVKDVGKLEALFDTLPDRLSSPLSIRSIAADLEVSHDAATTWLNIFDRMYLTFRISPYGGPKIRAVKKEQKLYFWDWTQARNRGQRFENLVALHLLKYCHFLEDGEGARMELRYLRDIHGREIDFVVLRDRKPLFAVECKAGSKEPIPAAKYYRERTQIRKFYQVHLGTEDYGDAERDTRVCPFTTFCRELELP